MRLYETARRATDDLREANQHMVSATIRAQELTEKVEAALTRSEQADRAACRGRVPGIFIGILGHDLPNPLGSIHLGVEVLLSRSDLDDHERKPPSSSSPALNAWRG